MNNCKCPQPADIFNNVCGGCLSPLSEGAEVMEHNVTAAQLKEAQLRMQGKEPLNPIGQCFESALHAYFQLRQLELKGAIKNLMLVHGIGTSNFPGQEGKKIAHAWLTFGKDDEFLAFEPTWGLITEAAKVIKDLQVEHVSTYRHSHLVKEITKNNNIDIGPWDKKILEVLGVREEI